MFTLYEKQTNKPVFTHSHLNACIGQAKFYHRHKNKTCHYYIKDETNNILYDVNSESIKYDK